MSSIKKLSVTEIDKLNKQLDAKKEVVVGDGKYKFMVDENIRKTKVKKMIIEFQELMELIENEQDLKSNITKDISFLYYMLILRTFTNIPIPLDVNKIITMCNTLVDSGLFKEIFSEAFTVEKMKTLNDELYKFLEVDNNANVQES